MLSTRKKKQSNRRLLLQLDDFDMDIIVGNAISDRQETATVNEGTGDQVLTVDNPGSNLAADENMVNLKTLERCFNEWIDKEMDNIVGTVEDKIQNAILIAIDSIITRKIELAIKSINASSGWDLTSVPANSECGELIRIIAIFGNVSGRNIKLYVFNTIDETRNNIPDEESELSVPGTHFDRQPHTHHDITNQKLLFNKFYCRRLSNYPQMRRIRITPIFSQLNSDITQKTDRIKYLNDVANDLPKPRSNFWNQNIVQPVVQNVIIRSSFVAHLENESQLKEAQVVFH